MFSCSSDNISDGASSFTTIRTTNSLASIFSCIMRPHTFETSNAPFSSCTTCRVSKVHIARCSGYTELCQIHHLCE